MGGYRMSVVVLYTRPGCHLCDEARNAILALRASGGEFELREIDIDADDDLHARFLERIPVVEVDGEIVAELHVESAELRLALAERGTGTVRSMTGDAGSEQR
jgi:thioredoxin-like negative regulator of GroEL